MGQKRQDVWVLHPRIGASFALIPITVGVCVLLIYIESLAGGWGPYILSSMLSAAPAAVFFGGTLLIWGPVVQWNRRRVIGTIYISVSLAGIVILSCFSASLIGPMEIIAATLGSSCVFGGVALILLNRLWWTPEHMRNLDEACPCPECGYDLRAQSECRCPECGKEYTLGQLLWARKQ